MAERYQQGCVDVVVMDERLTLEALDKVRPLITAALHQRLPQMVIDLRRVNLVDSAGLELLHEAHLSCFQKGGSLRMAAASPLIRDVLRVTGLDQELMMHGDVVTAAGAFAL